MEYTLAISSGGHVAATLPGTVALDPGAFLGCSAVVVSEASLAELRTHATNGVLPDPRTVGIPVVMRLSPLEFFHLFTDAEYAAITAAAVANPALLGWLLKASGARYIDLADPLTAAGLGVLVAAGLLTSARMADVLANRPAPTV